MQYIFRKYEGGGFLIPEEDLQKYLTEEQIREGKEAKKADPFEEVSFMAAGGMITFEEEG